MPAKKRKAALPASWDGRSTNAKPLGVYRSSVQAQATFSSGSELTTREYLLLRTLLHQARASRVVPDLGVVGSGHAGNGRGGGALKQTSVNG